MPATAKATKAKTKPKTKAKAAPKKRTPSVKKALVIVESPSKAKTIQKYLGRNYTVKASVGHIKDLPRSKLGVEVDKNFKPAYEIIRGKQKVIDTILKASENAQEVLLAPDPDREGEAIAWHVSEILPKKKKVSRILFNAITKKAILEALEQPQKLDKNKYNSQQARRILDRLVGYKISPLLWDKVRRGLSAGRVQSVAVRMVVERDAEIKKFKPDEYWTLEATFEHNGKPYIVRLAKIDGKDPELTSKDQTHSFIDSLKDTTYTVSKIQKKERQRRAPAPFITSKLQQEAARKLNFSAKKTMTLAQKLYEGMDLGEDGTHGLITYMRTDSVRITPEALTEVRNYINDRYGKDYLPESPIVYKTKKSSQDAHEAIRPTSLQLRPEKVKPFLERDSYNLYVLIWNRFVACQMSSAIYDQTTIELEGKTSDNRIALFRVTGSIMKFPGFTAVYEESTDDAPAAKKDDGPQELPKLTEGETQNSKEYKPEQHFTQPPPRFTDASLIKDLEEKGIGRPSTYASILSNIQDREYVEKRENRYFPSELGIVVTDLLVQAFPNVLNEKFTAEMEEKLDEIEEGKSEWLKMMKAFWKPFEKTLESAKENMKNIKSQEIPTKHNCEKCGATMVIKWGKLGQFLACSNYPECTFTAEFKKDEQGEIVLLPREVSDKMCPKCGAHMIVKRGRYGKFLACEKYPECKTTDSITTGIKCPGPCEDGELTQRMSRYKRIFFGCNKYPKCNYAVWDKPIEQPCPDCKHPILTEKLTKKQGLLLKCPVKECDYKKVLKTPEELADEKAAQDKIEAEKAAANDPGNNTNVA